MGHRECKDEEIARAIQDRDDLVQFRHFLGIQARTVTQAAAISKWARENNEDPADIYECGNLFDRESCALDRKRVPGRVGLTVRAAVWVCALLYFTAPWFLLAPRSGEVLVPVSGLSEWLWISETSARSFWGARVLTADKCSYGVKAGVPAWPQYSLMTSICDSFSDPRTKQLLGNIRKTTWLILFLFTAPWTPILWSAFRWVRSGVAASRMLRRVDGRSEQVADPHRLTSDQTVSSKIPLSSAPNGKQSEVASKTQQSGAQARAMGSDEVVNANGRQA